MLIFRIRAANRNALAVAWIFFASVLTVDNSINFVSDVKLSCSKCVKVEFL